MDKTKQTQVIITTPTGMKIYALFSPEKSSRFESLMQEGLTPFEAWNKVMDEFPATKEYMKRKRHTTEKHTTRPTETVCRKEYHLSQTEPSMTGPEKIMYNEKEISLPGTVMN